MPMSVELVDEEQPSTPKAKRVDRSAKQKKKKPRCDGSQLCIYLFCTVCFSVVAVCIGVFVLLHLDDDEPRDAAMCGDCYCILDDEVSTCPANAPPVYAQDFIDALLEQTPLNAIEKMSCDAFDDTECDFDPPRVELGDDAVCGLHYEDGNCTEYKMKSYENSTLAEAEGAFITHEGECGVCSTTQDLAVYLMHIDLTTEGQRCGLQAMANFFRGRDCYRDLGFTDACARLWADNSRKTGWNCGLTCVTSDIKDEDFNGDAPDCPLNDCLQCDEDVSGDTFKKFAGRTRRSSGLRSAIARTCSSISDIRQEACPKTIPLIE